MDDIRTIYADHAATTPICEAAFKAMLSVLKHEYGNPSSLYKKGQAVKKLIDDARTQIATAIGASSSEIYFTSGGTESDNWAIKGLMEKAATKGKKHIIASAIEHHAVLHTLFHLQKQGFEYTLLPVHDNGLVCPEELTKAIRPDTGLVTIMFANNEIGTIQPITELGAICHSVRIPFHTDAVQAVGHIPINVTQQNIDLLSMSAHKFNGPKGIGALYIRKGIQINTYQDGGAQEHNRRAGTENTAGIVGMAAALTEALTCLDERAFQLTKLRDYFINKALEIKNTRLNGHATKRLSGNISLCFDGIEGESLILLLDMKGISASSGSACTSGSLDPSHVLLALGLPHEVAHGSLRLSLGHDATIEDMDYIYSELVVAVNQLRDMSPLWEKINESGNGEE